MSRLWTFSPGVAPDVAIRDGRVHVVFGHAPWTWLVFDLAGELLEQRTQPIGYYPKTDGLVSLAHDGARFVSWMPGFVGVLRYPPGAPVGVHATGLSEAGVEFFYRQADASYPQTGAYCGDVPLSNPYASYGLWECRDDGTVRTWDECYYGPKPPGVAGQAHHSADGTIVVGEGATGGVAGQIDGRPFLLWPGADTKWPRVASDGTQVAIVAWGDPGPQVRLWIGRREELAAIGMLTPVLPPVPPELKGRALGLGYFFAISDRPADAGYGDNPSAPANCTIVLSNPEAARSPWPYWAPRGIGEGPRKIGSWVNVPGGESWPEVSAAELALYDGGHVLPETPCPGGITGLETYCDPGESLAACELRVRAWLTRWSPAPVWLIAQAYDRNGLEQDPQKLADLQALPLRLAAEYPQIRGVLWFSDGRRGGSRDHEWWRPVHARAVDLVRSPFNMTTHLEIVQAARAKYPAAIYDAEGRLTNPIGVPTAWRITTAVAYQLRELGWGLLEKSSGNNHLGYSVDVIINPRTRELVDILMDSEGAATPIWSPLDYATVDPTRWRPPVPPDGTAPVDPPAPGGLEARVAALEARVAGLIDAITEAGTRLVRG